MTDKKELQAQINQSRKSCSEDETKGAAPIIDRVFVGLKRIFPAYSHWIKSQADEDGIKKEWAVALKQHGVTDIEMIKRGFKHARMYCSPFFPSVGMFIDWCKTPEETKHPSHEAYLPPPDLTDEEQQKAKEYLKRIKEQL